MKENISSTEKKDAAYIYLFTCYVSIVFTFTYFLYEDIGEGNYIATLLVFIGYIVFVILNHLCIKKIISKKDLKMIELTLFMTLLAIFLSPLLIIFLVLILNSPLQIQHIG